MTESMLKKMPVDISAISVENVVNVEHLGSWPVSTVQYTSLADDIFLILSRARSQLTETNVEYADAFSLIQADLLGELFRLVVVGFEAECLMQGGQEPLFGATTSPILSQFLLMKSVDRLDEEIFRKLSVQENHLFRRSAKYILLRIRALSRQIGCDIRGGDRFSTNPLLDESGAIAFSRPVWIDALMKRAAFDRKKKRDIEEIGAAIADQILKSDLLEGNLRPLLRCIIGEVSRRVVGTYLRTAYSDVVNTKAVPGKLLGESLVSGSPKYAGRLLGMIYQRHGKPVIRFEHGGERPFFFDPGWPLSELHFCDEYRCFGWAGAEAFTKTYESSAVSANGAQTPIFVAQGSVRHKRMFRESIASKLPAPQRKTILYVPGLYLGEIYRSVSVRFKLNDIVYLNWQIWLISTLKKLGYYVIVKAHPGGLSLVGRLLEGYADEFWTARYDAQAARAYVNLFDFPGTAMMDALATTAPIILVDSGMRQTNQISFCDLLDRISVISGDMAPNNLLRVSSGELTAAVEEAIYKVDGSLDFVSKYFNQKSELDLG